MKFRYRFALMALVAATAGMASCDKLDAPYATIKKIDVDTTGKVRKVLLEDYTGHTCVNCPAAASTAHVLSASSGGRVIVMAVHAGAFAIPFPTGNFTADYTSAAGNQWNTDFQVVQNPSGMVNRKHFNGERVIGPDTWPGATSEELSLPQEAMILIDNNFVASTGTLTTVINTKFLTPLSGTYKLQVCILEDSLVSPQKNNDTIVGPVPIIYDYVFMDVLRDAINGTYGEALTSAVDTSRNYEKSYVYSLDPAWVPKNCHIVAFVFNAETLEVVQAEDAEILEP